MPIYEFYCAACHALYQFLSRSAEPARRPACPRCGRPDLERRPSSFAISKGRPEEEEGGVPEVDDTRLERAMASLEGEAAGLDEDDPASAARFLRRLYGTAGLEVGEGMAEALRRMEAGEDPESIEEDLGDVFEGESPAGGAARDVRRLRRRLLPPRVDPELHEL